MQQFDLNTIVGSLELSDEELEIVTAGAKGKSYSCTLSRGSSTCECTCQPSGAESA